MYGPVRVVKLVQRVEEMEVQTCGKPLDALIERVLCTNILSSDYFKELFSLKTYTEVVDEIYNQVDHVEPWMTGNCRGPSTAFCLLYKLFTMKFTVKQMQGLLDHPDSPFIRALGFLYLRYVGDPKTLWGWFEQYVRDPEEFAPGSNGKNTTMGVFVRDLLLNQYYFDTLFPRIPVPILRQITAHLEQMKLPTQPSGVTGTNSRHGSDDTARRPPSVKAALSVSFGQRAPHRAFTRDSSPVRRTAPVWEAARNSADNERDGRDKDRDRDYDRDKSRISRDKQRLDIPPRDRGRDREQERERDRTRDRERSRDYDREGSRGSRGRDDKDRDNSSRDSRYRDADRSRDERGRGSGRERGSDREDDYSRDRRRDRSADRDRGKERERERRYDDSDRKQRSRSPRRPSRSVDCADRADRDRSRSPGKSAPASSNLKKLLDVYGDASHTKSENANNSSFHSKPSTDEDVIHLGSSRWR